MEVELVQSKNDMMSLNNQLLEAIQRKLELSQELEAWQVWPLYLHKSFSSVLSSLLCSHHIFKSVSCVMKSSIHTFITEERLFFEAHYRQFYS